MNNASRMNFDEKRRIELRLELGQPLRLEISLSIRIDLNEVAQRFNEVDFLWRDCMQGCAVTSEQARFVVADNAIFDIERGAAMRWPPGLAVWRAFR